MNISRLSLGKIVAVLSLSLASLSANAVLLNPGDITALPGTTAAAEPQLAGVVLVDEIVPFSFTSDGFISGTVQQRIVRSDADGTLDFYWRVFNDINSQAAIGSFRIGDFYAPEYNANWRIDGLGDVAPDSAHRFTGINDASVNFLFSNGLLPGTSSNFFFFDTTATDYAMTAQFDLTGTGIGGISDLYAAYSPVSKIPEPSVIAILALGLISMGLGMNRRSQ